MTEPSGSTGAPICVCEPGECMGLGPATGSRCRCEEVRARRDAGAGVQPSAEAIKAADERMENFRPSERWDSGGRRQKTVAVTTAAYAIDAPAIAREAHAAGVAEGRAEAEARVEALLKHVHRFDHLRGRQATCRRCSALRHGLPDTPEGWREAESRFSSEGTT